MVKKTPNGRIRSPKGGGELEKEGEVRTLPRGIQEVKWLHKHPEDAQWTGTYCTGQITCKMGCEKKGNQKRRKRTWEGSGCWSDETPMQGSMDTRKNIQSNELYP